MSMDAINYDSRKCQMPATATHLRNLIKIAVVPKANIYEPWGRFEVELLSLAISAGMWFD